MFKLFLSQNFKCNCFWSKIRSRRFKKLFEEGEERIEANLDVVKIVRTVRNQKIVVKELLSEQHIH
jgi:hypothetical protein